MFDDISGWHAGVKRAPTLGGPIATNPFVPLVARLPAAATRRTTFRMSNVGSLAVLTLIVYVGLLLVLLLLTVVE